MQKLSHTTPGLKDHRRQKEGEKKIKSLYGVAGPQLGPHQSRRWVLSVGMLSRAAGAWLPCWEEREGM